MAQTVQVPLEAQRTTSWPHWVGRRNGAASAVVVLEPVVRVSLVVVEPVTEDTDAGDAGEADRPREKEIITEGTGEQNAAEPQMLVDCVKVVSLRALERVHQRTVEQNVDALVPQILQEGVEIASLMPHDRVQRRTAEYSVDVPVSQDVDAGGTDEIDRMTEELEIDTRSCSAGTDSAPELTSKVNESITEGIVEQNVDVPKPKNFQEHVEVVSLTPHARMQ